MPDISAVQFIFTEMYFLSHIETRRKQRLLYSKQSMHRRVRMLLVKTLRVSEELRSIKLAKATKRVEDGIEEPKSICMDFLTQHWTRILVNNAIERLNLEIKCRTKAIDAFPNRQSALMLVWPDCVM